MRVSRSPTPFLRRPLLAAMMAVMGAAGSATAIADGQITIIHTGDFHGHLTARPNLRSNADYPGQMVGGLARVATEIKKIQEGKGGAGNTLVLHTGDTIQGSGEALYTRGQAVVDVVDQLGIDGYTPGNWDFVYGADRFQELFATNLKPNLPTLPDQAQGAVNGAPFGTRWGGVASNLYLTSKVGNAPLDPTLIGTAQDTNISKAEYDTFAQWYTDKGQRVLPPYSVRILNGVKVGILGCTTSRGPQVVGRWVTDGLTFTDCAIEAPKFAEELRTKEGVEVVILLSEIEIGRNIQLIKSGITKPEQHIDLILNADMHEEVLQPIEVIDSVGNKTWIIESGQDGTLIGEITLSVHAGQVTGMEHIPHRIDDRIAEDVAVAKVIADVRAPYNEGFDASIPCDASSPYWNMFTASTCLNGPLSDVVGSTQVALHRSNHTHEAMPAAVEGSSHDFIADAIRWWAKSDMATVRGFRYGTHVAPGPITRNDLFHYVPIGPRVGKASRITLNQLRNQVDNSALSVFSSNPGNPVTPRPNYNNAVYAPGGTKAGQSPGAGLPVLGLAGNSMGWGGGWMFAYSAEGFHMDFDPYFLPSWQKVKANGAAGPGIDLGLNSQTTAPATDTSRARSLKVNITCKFLPPAEIVSTGCNVADTTTRYTTVMTNGTDGVYSTNWRTNYGVAPNNVLGAAAKDVFLLNPDGWQFLKGTPNNPLGVLAVRAPFQAPSFTVGGYWYAQSPNTINNCNNCYATGYSTVVGNPDAAYLLPVNMDANGNPSLDANGNPVYMRDANNAIMFGADAKPMVAGAPIDLTVIIEKYLASLGGEVTAANLPLNRISLQKALPASTTGFPVMQPLCGVVGKDPLATNACP